MPAQESLSLPKLPDVSVWRDDMDRASEAWRQGKYKKARKHLLKALKKGDETAAWYLGHLYHEGRGVKKDAKAAFKFYRQAALSYDENAPKDRRFMIAVDALVRVADVYRDGSEAAGIKRNTNRAHRIYNIASSHGHPGADFGLAVMFLKGIGVKKHPRRGLNWLTMLHASVMRRLRPCWATCTGKACMCVRTQRMPSCGTSLRVKQPIRLSGHIFARLDSMLSTVSEKERAKAHKLASRWNKKHPVRARILQVTD